MASVKPGMKVGIGGATFHLYVFIAQSNFLWGFFRGGR